MPALLTLLATGLLALHAAAQALPQDVDRALAAARPWLATPAADRPPAPDLDAPLTDAAVAALLPQLFAALRDAARAAGEDDLPTPHPADDTNAPPPASLQIGDHSLPYVVMAKGGRPDGGWPLFLCLHGGGANPQAAGPHAWTVNDREWAAQQQLTRRVYQPAGIYLIPRMADDRLGRWWHDHNQLAFDALIRRCLLFADVDPDRVYMMGISEGGYGAIRFAGNRPDRFAALGGMAAAEPLASSPPENMRNAPLRIDIGERDTMFDRVGLARRMGERLAELRDQDQGGYDCVVNVQPGRGHGIDYSLTPPWLAERTRDPRPERVVWTVRKFHSLLPGQRYWLALDGAPAELPLFLDARIADNRVVITAERPGAEPGSRIAATGGSLLVRLDDRLVDLDRPVTIVVNGHERPATTPRRRLAVMLRTLAERGDPRLCFSAEVAVDLAPAPPSAGPSSPDRRDR